MEPLCIAPPPYLSRDPRSALGRALGRSSSRVRGERESGFEMWCELNRIVSKSESKEINEKNFLGVTFLILLRRSEGPVALCKTDKAKYRDTFF